MTAMGTSDCEYWFCVTIKNIFNALENAWGFMWTRDTDAQSQRVHIFFPNVEVDRTLPADCEKLIFLFGIAVEIGESILLHLN